MRLAIERQVDLLPCAVEAGFLGTGPLFLLRAGTAMFIAAWEQRMSLQEVLVAVLVEDQLAGFRFLAIGGRRAQHRDALAVLNLDHVVVFGGIK